MFKSSCANRANSSPTRAKHKEFGKDRARRENDIIPDDFHKMYEAADTTICRSIGTARGTDLEEWPRFRTTAQREL
jgi:hypothetical protein